MSVPLSDFQPRSMLHAPEHKVARSRYPVIDFHAHLAWSPQALLGDPGDWLTVMDRKNVTAMVHLTGGHGEYLERTIAQLQTAQLQTAHPGRFYVFTEPMWNRASEPGYAQAQADEVERAARAGARGLKVLKTLGLFLRENGYGDLVKVDDPRFDPMWEVCGALGLPVGIHVSDPEAFFLPIDRFNERYEELHNHPDWSFHGRDFPSDRELQEARNRVVARHPRTTFVVLHVGNNAENLAYVSESMDRFPNMHVDIAARIGELGRQPRAARKFIDRYQDRVIFGTDAVPNGVEFPQQVFCDELYEIYYRFLETEDEDFDYAPAPTPPQGRWRISGLGLSDEVLRKVYCENAQRLLRIS